MRSGVTPRVKLIRHGRARVVRWAGVSFALCSGCGAEPPPPAAAPDRQAPHEPSAAVSTPVAEPSAAPSPSTAPPSRLEPIALALFEDGARHYRNANGVAEYPRYLPEQYVAIAENILLHQRDNGGWRENWDPARILGEDEKRAVLAERSKTDTSLDNRTSYTHAEYLAEVFRRTRDALFGDAFRRGLDFVLAAQHPSGGFPHSYPETNGYRGFVTLMDGVTTGALRMLKKAAEGRPPFDFLDEATRERCRRAVELGEHALLKLQVHVKGRLTVWAGQYDPATLEPAQARAFELPSLVSAESVFVVRYLMEIEKPSPEVIAAVEAAARWFERAKLRGIRMETVEAEPVRYRFHTSRDDRRIVRDPKAPPLWARFYEIDTNRPFMANRDGKKVYSLAEVERERRTGYRWYGYFATELLERELPAWRAKHGVAAEGR